MPLLVNIQQVATNDVRLQGELSCAEMDWDTRDEMIHIQQPLQYDLQAEKTENGILVRGHLRQVSGLRVCSLSQTLCPGDQGRSLELPLGAGGRGKSRDY